MTNAISFNIPVACKFHYQGGNLKLAGNGSITLAPDGITLRGQRPASGLGRMIIRIGLLFIGVLAVSIPAVPIQMWLGNDDGGIHPATYIIVILLMGILFPPLYRLAARLNLSAGGEDQTSIFLPLREIIGVGPHPYSGQMGISHRLAGKWMHSTIYFDAATETGAVQEHIQKLLNSKG